MHSKAFYNAYMLVSKYGIDYEMHLRQEISTVIWYRTHVHTRFSEWAEDELERKKAKNTRPESRKPSVTALRSGTKQSNAHYICIL